MEQDGSYEPALPACPLLRDGCPPPGDSFCINHLEVTGPLPNPVLIRLMAVVDQIVLILTILLAADDVSAVDVMLG
jgi:hypothetical protein